jgi:hypothetical protein
MSFVSNCGFIPWEFIFVKTCFYYQIISPFILNLGMRRVLGDEIKNMEVGKLGRALRYCCLTAVLAAIFLLTDDERQ